MVGKIVPLMHYILRSADIHNPCSANEPHKHKIIMQLINYGNLTRIYFTLVCLYFVI